MTSKEAEEKYLEYLEGHIGNVSKALDVLSTLNIPFIDDNLDKLKEIVKDHDASKYEEPEWSAYLHHFYPTNDDESKMEEEFDIAVKHHIQSNPHHWNYWCDENNNLKDDIDELEYKLYAVERICDWLAMAAQHNEGPTDYYEINKDFIVQPDYARDLCEEIFPKVPEDFSKDMWKGTRGELDEGESLISLIGGSNGKTNNRVKRWFTLDMKTYYPSWRGGRTTYYLCFNPSIEEAITYSKKLYDYIEKGYKYLIEYTPCSIPWKSKTAGVIISMRNLKILDKKPIEEVKESKDDLLNEAKASQLRNKTKAEDPARVQKSKNVKSTYIGMSKFGILNFKTTSESRGGYHYQTIEFQSLKPFEDAIKKNGKVMPDDIKKALNDDDINVFCSDESFTYWAWYHQAYQNDYAYIDDNIPNLDKRLQAPKVNNVRLAGALCKHLYSVLEYVMKPFVLLAISDDMSKFLAGNKEDKMNKQDVATQNWYDAVKQWDAEDVQKYTGLTKQQILMDLSKAIEINPKTNLDDFVDDLMDDILKNMKGQPDPKLEKLIADKVIDTLELDKEFNEAQPKEEIENDIE